METAVTDPKPVKAPTWMLCPKCDRIGAQSEDDPRLCDVCLPPPDVAEALAREVRLRLAAAKAAASAGPQEWDHRAVAPDSEHVWLWRAGWNRGHLFAIATDTSYCDEVWTAKPVGARPVVADPETTRACRACWHAYRAVRGSR